MNTVAVSQHKVLSDLAHEINVRLQKADDHRLSAALKLAEAKAACKSARVPFKAWVVKEIRGVGYREANKLALIGGSPDPEKALEDQRNNNKTAEANRRSQSKIAHVGDFGTITSLPAPKRGKAAVAARVCDGLSLRPMIPRIFPHANVS